MWGDMSLWNVQGPLLHSRDHIVPRILTNDYTFNQCLSFQHFTGDHAPRPLLFIEESVFVQVLVFKIPPPPPRKTYIVYRNIVEAVLHFIIVPVSFGQNEFDDI